MMPAAAHVVEINPRWRRFLQVVLALWGVASTQGAAQGNCPAQLNALSSCNTQLAAELACSQKALLQNDTTRAVLGCLGSLRDCQMKCLDRLGDIGLPVNRSVAECSVSQQRMMQFSGSPELVITFHTDEATGLRTPKVLPTTLTGESPMPYLTYLGDYQSCMLEQGTQYCLVDASVEQGPLTLKALLGLCRPASCSQDEVTEALAPLADQLGMGSYSVACRTQHTRPPPVVWTAVKATALVLVLVIVVLLAVGTVRDLRKGWQAPGLGDPRQPLVLESQGSRAAWVRATAVFADLGQAWSLQRNITSFSRTRSEDPTVFMGALDGLRVLSTLWVILGHVVIWPMLSIQYDNFGMLMPPEGRLTELWFQIVPGGYFAVDTFFWLSGFLGARGFHAKVKRSPRLLTAKGFCLGLYPLSIFARWLRLTPVYAFILLMSQTWYSDIGRGGLLWNITPRGSGGCANSIDNDACKKYWWANLLYINNIYSASGGCMMHGWYLDCDMQMFLTLPILVLMRERAGKAVGWAAVAALMAVSIVGNAYVIATKHLVTDPVLGSLGGTFMHDVYEVSWLRAQPYLIGIGCAWVLEEILASHKEQEVIQPSEGRRGAGVRNLELGNNFGHQRSMDPEPLLGDGSPASRRAPLLGRGAVLTMLAVFLQLLSFALMCLVVFLPVGRYQCESLMSCIKMDTSPWSETMHATYGALNHAIWGLGLGCLMLLCFLRAPGTWWINTLLGDKAWQSPVKLTYVAYLIHPLVLVLLYCQGDSSLHYLDTTTACYFLAFSVMVFVLAMFIWLAVEKPLANLTAKFLGAIGGGGGGDA